MSLKLIAAVAENRVIAKDDGMPWDLPDEYEHYRRIIDGQTVIMGRRSYEIFGKDLTSRHAVVVSHSREALEGAIVCGSLEEAVEKAKSLGREAYVNGGASIYKQAIALVDVMNLSIVKGEFEGDAYFPEFEESAWDVVERVDHGGWEFRRYVRK
ncbi:MAG TPA: dihydrofolate reductase [Lacipirellula sp.]